MPSTRILIADDEPDLVRMLEMKLQRAGFEVMTACNGKDAVQKTHTFRPDAVLMDIMMPELDGHSAMVQIKQEICPAPLVMMLTARDSIDSISTAIQDGADDYILKPFSPKDLLSRLMVALIKCGKLPQVKVQ